MSVKICEDLREVRPLKSKKQYHNADKRVHSNGILSGAVGQKDISSLDDFR